MKLRNLRRITIIILVILSIVMLIMVLLYSGIVWPNKLFASRYSIHGIDVSNHQKDIDWEKVFKDNKIKFVFIKATEGKDYKDKYFSKNWEMASKTGLYIGAYHYLTITSSGKEQAENFIESVPIGERFLPPVIDIEESGLEKKAFKQELSNFINIIEEHYGQKPILYTVYSLYNQYIKGDFEEYPIWIRDIIKPPSLGSRTWKLWQYCDRGRVSGIDTFVDLNVFNGSIDELKALVFTKQGFRTDIEPIISRFPKLGTINKCYWQADVIGENKRNIVPGPSSYSMKGFIIPDSKWLDELKIQYEWLNVDNRLRHSLDTDILHVKLLKWSYSEEFNKYIMPASYIGKFYLDLQSGIAYFEVEK